MRHIEGHAIGADLTLAAADPDVARVVKRSYFFTHHTAAILT